MCVCTPDINSQNYSKTKLECHVTIVHGLQKHVQNNTSVTPFREKKIKNRKSYENWWGFFRLQFSQLFEYLKTYLYV